MRDFLVILFLLIKTPHFLNFLSSKNESFLKLINLQKMRDFLNFINFIKNLKYPKNAGFFGFRFF